VSDYVYTFNLSIGYPSAEQQETFDLVDDLDYEVEELEDPENLGRVLNQEVEDWKWRHIETWTEKVDE
jgi:hypothetical protein